MWKTDVLTTIFSFSSVDTSKLYVPEEAEKPIETVVVVTAVSFFRLQVTFSVDVEKKGVLYSLAVG